MTRADNSRFLARAAALRHQQALDRVRSAIENLDRSGHAVTYSSVARAAEPPEAGSTASPSSETPSRGYAHNGRALRRSHPPSEPLPRHYENASTAYAKKSADSGPKTPPCAINSHAGSERTESIIEPHVDDMSSAQHRRSRHPCTRGLKITAH